MLYYINKIRSSNKIQAVILGIIGLGVVTVLTSYNIEDPSFNSVTTEYPSNLVGIFGFLFIGFFYINVLGLAAFYHTAACLFGGEIVGMEDIVHHLYVCW